MAEPTTETGDYGTHFPNSNKIHRPISDGTNVPLREIHLTPTERDDADPEPNPSLIVYDTSGPYMDPTYTHDVKKGLPALRSQWIEQRDDTESYEPRGYMSGDDGKLGDKRREPFPGLQRKPRKARPAPLSQE